MGSIVSTNSAAGAADAGRPEDQKCPMVCHHWKSKGWCRMEAECKFLHPDHNRGIGSKPRRGRRGRCGDSSAPGSSSSSCTSSPPQVECMPQLGSINPVQQSLSLSMALPVQQQVMLQQQVLQQVLQQLPLQVPQAMLVGLRSWALTCGMWRCVEVGGC